MSDPAKLWTLMTPMARKWGLDNPAETAKLFFSWAEIIGPELAAKCEPVSIKAGVLQVKTASAAWASELKYLAPAMIKKLNEAVGGQLVKQIVASVSVDGRTRGGRAADRTPRSHPVGAPRRHPADREKPTPRTPSAREVEEVEAITAKIPDAKVADAAKRALLAGKMRRRGG